MIAQNFDTVDAMMTHQSEAIVDHVDKQSKKSSESEQNRETISQLQCRKDHLQGEVEKLEGKNDHLHGEVEKLKGELFELKGRFEEDQRQRGHQ